MSATAVAHKTLFAMNTRLDLVFWGEEAAVADTIHPLIRSEILRLEKVLSRFDPSAETFHLNQKAHKQAFYTSSTLFQLIEECLRLSAHTLGYFDICSAPGCSLSLTGKIELDTDAQSVRLLQAESQLDFGAVGKGMALRSVALILEEFSIKNTFISFGESSILTRGHHPQGTYWPMGFQAGHDIQETLQLTNDAVSISGLHGQKAHIINPKTGNLIQHPMTICVQADDPVIAEVLSTALIAAPAEKHSDIYTNFDTKKILYSHQLT